MIEALSEHAPALVVAAPLAAAPIAILMPRGPAAGIWSSLIAFVAFGGAIFLLAAVTASGGAISYDLGGWAPPHGIEYRIDAANAFVMMLVGGAAALAFPFATVQFGKLFSAERQRWVFAAMLLVLSGHLGVLATGDAFNMFVFFEIGSLATYVLVASGGEGDRRALTAAFNYLIMGTIGATFFVIGVGLLFMATGTLNMGDIAERITLENRVVEAGFAFIVVGIGLKLALFPLHLWLPNAYAFAPHAVTAFLAATSTKVAIYVLARFAFGVFASDESAVADAVRILTFALAGAGMIIASFAAVFQVDVKRALAYSSVGQVGYIVLGLALATEAGVAAAFLHLFIHGVMKGAMFLALGAAAIKTAGCRFEAIYGLGRRAPLLAGAITLCGIGLIGAPPTAGFVSKWYLVQAAIEAHSWAAVGLILASSLIAVAYVWTIVTAMYFRPAPANAQPVGPFALAPALIGAALVVVFGVYAEPLVQVSEAAAQALLTGWRL